VAVSGLARDFGGSLGQNIARDAAENIVMGDHAATRALVEDMARNEQINYLAIADRDGHIVASTQAGETDRALPAVATATRPLSNGIASYQARLAGTHGLQDTLMFDVPIRYQTKTVGSLRLGVSEAPLQAAQNTALGVIALVLLTTLATVLLTAYLLFRRLRGALDLLAASLLRAARGDYLHRIRIARRDELGRVFAAFNLLGETLAAPRETVAVVAEVHKPDLLLQPTQIIPAARTREPENSP
jgi:serine/threonine-protein kinase